MANPAVVQPKNLPTAVADKTKTRNLRMAVAKIRTRRAAVVMDNSNPPATARRVDTDNQRTTRRTLTALDARLKRARMVVATHLTVALATPKRLPVTETRRVLTAVRRRKPPTTEVLVASSRRALTAARRRKPPITEVLVASSRRALTAARRRKPHHTADSRPLLAVMMTISPRAVVKVVMDARKSLNAVVDRVAMVVAVTMKTSLNAVAKVDSAATRMSLNVVARVAMEVVAATRTSLNVVVTEVVGATTRMNPRDVAQVDAVEATMRMNPSVVAKVVMDVGVRTQDTKQMYDLV